MADEKIKTAALKVPLDMIPLHALKGAARVFQHGAHKYAPGNFLKATIKDGAVARYTGALLRHLADMQDADGRWVDNFASLDEESGLPEIDHMLAGLMMARAIMTQCGKLPADPGMSKMILQDAAESNAALKEPPAFVGDVEELFTKLDRKRDMVIQRLVRSSAYGKGVCRHCGDYTCGCEDRE